MKKKAKNQVRVMTGASIGIGLVTVKVAAKMGMTAISQWVQHLERLSKSSVTKSESVIPLLSQGMRQLMEAGSHVAKTKVKPAIEEWRQRN